MSMSMGVYCITHQESGKRYIGSTVNIQTRFYIHKYYLTRGTHGNRKLQNAWNKYGSEAFRFHILDYCEDKDELIVCEQQWMDSLAPYYNIRKFAQNNVGVKWTEAQYVKMRELNLGAKNPQFGKKLTDEHRARLSQAGKGRPHSQQHKDNIAKALRGKKKSPEHIAKHAATQRGTKRSPEHLAKLWEGNRAYWERKRNSTTPSVELVADAS